jgi:hypothetical protein
MKPTKPMKSKREFIGLWYGKPIFSCEKEKILKIIRHLADLLASITRDSPKIKTEIECEIIKLQTYLE